jgi:hypothetical protein
MTDPELLARRKKRYAEDAEYRERLLAGNRARHHRNKDKINARKRHRWATDPAYRANHMARVNKEMRRKSQLKRVYGLSVEELDAMRQRQHGACAICSAKRELCVDHCHGSKVVGGLLCRKCNTGLGCFDDSPALMVTAAAYTMRVRPQAFSSASLAKLRLALLDLLQAIESRSKSRFKSSDAKIPAPQRRASSRQIKSVAAALTAVARSLPASSPARRGSARTARAAASPGPRSAQRPARPRAAARSRRRDG